MWVFANELDGVIVFAMAVKNANWKLGMYFNSGRGFILNYE